jgi:hypothetical protein
MARRYVGVARIEGTDVGVEVRAKNEQAARKECAEVLRAAYPKTKELPQITVSRLKEKGGLWQPVKAYTMGMLPGVTTWLAPKDIEMTDICVSKDNVIEFPLVPTKEDKKVKECKSLTPTKTASKWKDIKLGITEAVLKEMAHGIRTYNATNEVES